MRGTTSSAQQTVQPPSTQYITRRAPKWSDIQPPSARMTPDGRLKIAAIRPAVATLMP